MRDHETEDDMVAARAQDFAVLAENHQALIDALPTVTPLPARPTADQLRQYDTQHLVRGQQLLAACQDYKRRVRETVEQHQTEEGALRERLQSPPATTGL